MTLNVIKTLHKALLKYLTNDSKDRGNTALTGNGTAAQRRARMEGRVYGISTASRALHPAPLQRRHGWASAPHLRAFPSTQRRRCFRC